MPMHWKFNLGTDWDVNENIVLNPGLFYMFQKGATELILKSHLTYKLQNEDYDIRAHLGYRIKDALLVGVGMRYKDFVGSINYDYNTSYLNNYTGGNGGVELSISYQGGFGTTPSRGSFN